MRRLLRLESTESVVQPDFRRNPKRKNIFEGIRLSLPKTGKAGQYGIGQCAECGGEVKVLVSPRRNPHSSKLGRAVSMKDHDLCRRCWRRPHASTTPSGDRGAPSFHVYWRQEITSLVCLSRILLPCREKPPETSWWANTFRIGFSQHL